MEKMQQDSVSLFNVPESITFTDSNGKSVKYSGLKIVNYGHIGLTNNMPTYSVTFSFTEQEEEVNKEAAHGS